MRALLCLSLPLLTLALAGGCGDKDDADDDTGTGCVPTDEVCNDRDDDCDGEIDEGVATTSWYPDADLDGWGAPGTPVEACAQPAGHVSNDDDCDDDNDAINPDGTESCNDLDDDCDGLVDANDSDVVDAVEYYSDADGDGWGLGMVSLRACELPDNAATKGGDCDDGNEAVNPSAVEVCNGIDDDCDDAVDADDEDIDAGTWYPDADLDGYGVSDGSVEACEEPDGDWAEVDGDCDDSRDDTNPGAEEICRDGIDNDCDGTANSCEVLAGTVYVGGDEDARLYGACTGFGYHTRSADVDGDGSMDVLASCYGLSEAASYAGGAYVFSSPARGDSLTSTDAYGYLSTRVSNDYFGMTLEVGDIDGDGVVDVVMTNNSGDLQAWLGPMRSGGDTASDIEITGKEYSTVDVTSSAVVDLDGSGQAAIVLADLFGDTDYSNAGTVAFITEPDGGGDFLDLASGVVTGLDSSDYFGWALRGGDMDGDGVDDVVMSAIYGDVYGAWIASGDEVLGATITYEELSRSFTDSGRTHGQFGYSLATPRDLDGDGHADLVLGAPYDSTYSAASVYVLLGPVERAVDVSDADVVLYGDQGAMGRQLDSVPDMDGDDDAELVIGSYQDDSYTTDGGAAWVFYDLPSGTADVADADLAILGADSYYSWGYGISGLDDLDGDGNGEIAVTASGLAYVSLWFGGAL